VLLRPESVVSSDGHTIPGALAYPDVQFRFRVSAGKGQASKMRGALSGGVRIDVSSLIKSPVDVVR
jgi:hypothetical protein